MASPTFLGIPLEIRLVIYEIFLAEHQRVSRRDQPSNSHLRLLRTCRTVNAEAGYLLRQYISLRNELEIVPFCSAVHSQRAALIRWADVANDGRMIEDLESGQTAPASQLYRALSKLVSLERLRVFNVRNSHPYALSVPHTRYRLWYELAMYPVSQPSIPHLLSYELYLDPTTRVVPFQIIPSDKIVSLRLSGDCHVVNRPNFPALRHLTLHGITGNYFDQLRFSDFASDCKLETFIHVQGHRLGFEIRDFHLESLVWGPGSHLRKLVLLGSSRLSSAVICSCLQHLPELEYLALSIVTVTELRGNFIHVLPEMLSVFKVQITYAWYSIPLIEEERQICNALEVRILQRQTPPAAVWVSFHSKLMNEEGRQKRWETLAAAAGITLKIGPWEDAEET